MSEECDVLHEMLAIETLEQGRHDYWVDWKWCLSHGFAMEPFGSSGKMLFRRKFEYRSHSFSIVVDVSYEGGTLPYGEYKGTIMAFVSNIVGNEYGWTQYNHYVDVVPPEIGDSAEKTVMHCLSRQLASIDKAIEYCREHKTTI